MNGISAFRSPFSCKKNKKMGCKPLKEHFGKSLVEGCKVFFTFGADKPDRPQHLRVIFSGGETAVGILNIMSCNDNIFSNFNKVCIISAGWTGDEIGGRSIFHGHGVFVFFGEWQNLLLQ